MLWNAVRSASVAVTGTGRPRRDAILNTYRELISDQNTENTDAAIL
jgi:hypothetical protein